MKPAGLFDSLGGGHISRADVALLDGGQMRSKHRHYMDDGRKTHHNVKDRQVHATKQGSEQVDPKASQRKMQTAKNDEKQR